MDSFPKHQSIFDLRFTQIRQVDCGSDTKEVNDMLSAGWVLLRIRTETSNRDNDIVELPIYILGLPSE